MELPDHTIVQLNAHSEITATFSHRERRVMCPRGEVRFLVAKDAERPFFVDTPHATVRTIGTTFNVHVTPSATDVTLIEGRIAVSGNVNHHAVSIGRELELQSGQNVRVIPSGDITFHQGRSVPEANAWPQMLIAFQRTKLIDLVADVNRYRAQPIVITDPKLAALEVNGLLNVFSSEPFWEALAAAGELRVEQREDGSVLLAPVER